MSIFQSLWNYTNPITVRELRRCRLVKRTGMVIGVIYLLAVIAYVLVLFLLPSERNMITDVPWAINSFCFFWAFFGTLATISATSKSMNYRWEDPLMSLIGMSPAAQARGFLCYFAIMMFCAAILPIPFLVATLIAGLFGPQAALCTEICTSGILVLLVIFFIGNAAAAYFFSYFAPVKGKMERFLASFCALFFPILNFIPWAVFGSTFDRPFDQEETFFVLLIVWLVIPLIQYCVSCCLIISHFSTPHRRFGLAIFLNLCAYFALNIVLALFHSLATSVA